MRTTTQILTVLALTTSLVACEMGEDLGDFEPSDELLDTLDEAEANAELPDAIIAGGRPDFTNHVSVGYLSAPDGYICSGQRITNTLFLTAGHCVNYINSKNIAWNRVKVGFGRRSLDFHVKATRAWVHPKYNNQPGNPFDMGLVVMASGIPYVPKATIGRAAVGQSVMLVGYGAGTYERRSGYATITQRVSNGHFGISGADAGVCVGDSGGGAMNPYKQNQVLTINAYGPSGCSRTNVSGATDLRRDQNWQALAYVGAKFD